MTTQHVQAPLSVRDRYAGLLLGALVADSLALAPHWIYEHEEIVGRFGRVSEFHEPPEDHYHAGKSRGSQTHYGDQTLVLLDSIQACGENFVVEDFSRRWRHFWMKSTSYRDKATKATLANLEEGRGLTRSGSSSHDLAGAVRIAPILLALRNEEEPTIIGAVRAQTAMTHATPEVIDAAEFIAHLVSILMRGVTVSTALEMAAGMSYRKLQPRAYLKRAEEVRHLSTVEAVGELGQSCPIDKALPAVFTILLQHGDNLEEALVENVMAGGDSAARGMALGTILGAAQGARAVPERWTHSLQARRQIDQFLKAVGLGAIE